MMHLKSTWFWVAVYGVMTSFDVMITYVFVSRDSFGIGAEGNPFLSSLMEQFGIWQALTISVLIEFLYCGLILGVFCTFLKYKMKKRSEEFCHKVDVLVFNIGIPFAMMAGVLLHLFGVLSWLVFLIMGSIDLVGFLKLFMAITILCGIFQAYHVHKLSSKSKSSSKDSQDN